MVAERILVVDDEELNRDLLQQILDREGYQVAIAANGQEALALLRQETFHVVLTDLKMPGMTGVEVIRETEDARPFHPGHYSYGLWFGRNGCGSDESGGVRLCDQARQAR